MGIVSIVGSVQGCFASHGLRVADVDEFWGVGGDIGASYHPGVSGHPGAFATCQPEGGS